MNSYETHTPLISVLIAAYNAEKYIKECIESVQNQSYRNIEIIIRDDCSTDNTLNIIHVMASKDSRIIVRKNKQNLGYLKTFNILLSEAQGDYISFVDADDFIEHNKILYQYDFLSKKPDIGLIGTQHCSINEKNEKINKSSYPLTHAEIKNQMKSDMCFCGSSVMITKEVAKRIGGYREYFIGCVAEDYDWIFRILDSYNVANLDYIGYFYRFHNNTLTRKVNTDLKKRNIHEIVRYLALERKKEGSDFIMRNDKEGEQKCFDTVNQKYNEDEGKLFREVAVEFAINKDLSNTIYYLQKSLKASIFKTIKPIAYSIILLTLPYSFLTKIKKITKINHIAKKV